MLKKTQQKSVKNFVSLPVSGYFNVSVTSHQMFLGRTSTLQQLGLNPSQLLVLGFRSKAVHPEGPARKTSVCAVSFKNHRSPIKFHPPTSVGHKARRETQQTKEKQRLCVSISVRVVQS